MLHLAFYQLLDRGQSATWRTPDAGRAMRVEFIVRTPPPEVRPTSPAPQRHSATSTVEASEAVPRPARRPRAAVTAPLVETDTRESRAGAALDLRWQAPSENETGFPLTPARQAESFPIALEGPDRLGLRRQLTGQMIIEGAAKQLGLWPPGYESDPCPRVKRNIAGLMTDTRPEGRAALGEELRRQRVACRE